MIAYPVAPDLAAALREDVPLSRTAEAAAELAGGAVYLADEVHPIAFAAIADAEAIFPNLYGDGRFNVIWRDGAWRVLVRYWRLAPLAPVAVNALGALRRPLGRARTPEEAQLLLGIAAELVREATPRRYRSIGRARAAARALLDTGLASLRECEDGTYEILIAFWRPLPSAGARALTLPQREELAERAAAPLRGLRPQADPYIGLFESIAPENPAIVLAEEGDGRARGE